MMLLSVPELVIYKYLWPSLNFEQRSPLYGREIISTILYRAYFGEKTRQIVRIHCGHCV